MTDDLAETLFRALALVLDDAQRSILAVAKYLDVDPDRARTELQVAAYRLEDAAEALRLYRAPRPTRLPNNVVEFRHPLERWGTQS